VLVVLHACYLTRAMYVDHLISISDPSTGAAIQVAPEDVMRAFGEVHKTLFRANGATSTQGEGQGREIEKGSTWASIVCDLYQFELVFRNQRHTPDIAAEEFAALDECLEIAEGAYVAVLGGGVDGAVRAASRGAHNVVAESIHALLDGWAGCAFKVDSSFRLGGAPGCRQQLPGTSWEIETRGIHGYEHDDREQPWPTLLPICLFTTRWCPMHPEVSSQLVWEKKSRLERSTTHHQQQVLCLARAETYWRWCGEVAEAPLSMIFMHDSLSNASWSTYPEDGGEGASRRVGREGQKLVGSYETESSGWRRLHAWVQDQELVVAPPAGGGSGVAPRMEDLVAALRNWNALVPDPLKHGAFSVDTAEAVVAHVYGHCQSYWWEGMGAASLPAAWHGEILQDWWVVTLLDAMTGGFFVDLAAYDAVAYSNSYALERDYGWGGICIEPQANHWKGLLHRKCVAVAAVVGHAIGAEVEFDIQYGSGVAGVVSDDMPNRGASRKQRDSEESHWGAEAPKRVTYRTVTVGKILQDFKAPPVIHYLSLDMEGSEHLVLQTFPFDLHRVLVITIERPDLCARTILRQQSYVYLRDLAGQDEIWVHPTLPELARKLEKYGRREPRRDDSMSQSADTARKCRQMSESLAQGLLQGCCRPNLQSTEPGARRDNAEKGGG
jgi:hypothetical protein